MTDHKAIADAELHEPKGVVSASDGQIYVADGTGSGDWRHEAHSAFHYSDIGTGTTITTPTVYTLVGPATTADNDPHDFTHNSLGRLTYTGTETVDVHIVSAITFKHSTGGGADCYFDIHKNGASLAGAEFVRSASSADFGSIILVGHGSLTTNDYLEVWCKVASGSITVHAMALNVSGKI